MSQHRDWMVAAVAALLVAALVAVVLGLAGTDASDSSANKALAADQHEFGPALTANDTRPPTTDDAGAEAESHGRSEPSGKPGDAAPSSVPSYLGVSGLGSSAVIDQPRCVGHVEQLSLGRLEKIVGTDLGVAWSGFELTPPSRRCGRVRLTVRAGQAQGGTAAVQITGRFGDEGLSNVRCQGGTCRVNNAPDRRVTLVNVR